MESTMIVSKLITLFEFDHLPFAKFLHQSNISTFKDIFRFNEFQILQTQTDHPLVAFRHGTFDTDSGEIIILRDDIESRKIVLEIEGESTNADELLDRFIEIFREISENSDDDFMKPIVLTRDSVIIAKMSFHAKSLLHPDLLDFVTNQVSAKSKLKQGDPVPNLHTISFRIDYNPTDDSLLDYRISLTRKEFSIGPRDGTPLDQQIFVSKAPVSTSDHIELLEELEKNYS